MRGSNDWEISFRFAASPNRRNLLIGDIGGISKRGWEYLRVSYADGEDEATGFLMKKPVAVSVKQILRVRRLLKAGDRDVTATQAAVRQRPTR